MFIVLREAETLSFDFCRLPGSVSLYRLKHVHLHARLPRGSLGCACISPTLLSLVEIREHLHCKATITFVKKAGLALNSPSANVVLVRYPNPPSYVN